MLYRPSNFKKSSRAVTAVAAAGLFVSASLMATGPVSAEPIGKNFTAACDAIKDGGKQTACLVDTIKKDTAAKERDITRLKAEGAAADQLVVCLTDLKKFKEKNPDGFAKLGPINKETACSAAARIPRPTASLN